VARAVATPLPQTLARPVVYRRSARSCPARGDVPVGPPERASSGSTGTRRVLSGRGQHPGRLEHSPARSPRRVSAAAGPPLPRAARLFLGLVSPGPAVRPFSGSCSMTQRMHDR
jgi:hypothetical protein